MSEEKTNKLIKHLWDMIDELTKNEEKLKIELGKEKEKNKELEKQLKLKNGDIDYISNKINNHFIDDVTLKNNYISKDKIKELLENEIIDISGFRCIAVEDIENLLEV